MIKKKLWQDMLCIRNYDVITKTIVSTHVLLSKNALCTLNNI